MTPSMELWSVPSDYRFCEGNTIKDHNARSISQSSALSRYVNPTSVRGKVPRMTRGQDHYLQQLVSPYKDVEGLHVKFHYNLYHKSVQIVDHYLYVNFSLLQFQHSIYISVISFRSDF